MPLTPRGYTTKQEVEDFLFADLDPAYDAALDDLIAKAEDFVDRVCRRRFDSYNMDQVIDGNGEMVISIPDTQSLTQIVLDPYYGNLLTTTYDGAGEGADWALEPASALSDGEPYRRLRLLGGGIAVTNPLAAYVFPRPGKVTLTGTFGWATVPGPIRLATTMLVAEVTRRWRNSDAGDISSLTEGNYSVTFEKVAAGDEWRRMVGPYKRARTRL